MRYLIIFFFFFVFNAFQFNALAPCIDFSSSGKACTFCTAGQEPASLSLHPLFNSVCYLGVLKIHLSFDCRDMQVEAAVYEVRPYNFTDKKRNLARL